MYCCFVFIRSRGINSSLCLLCWKSKSVSYRAYWSRRSLITYQSNGTKVSLFWFGDLCSNGNLSHSLVYCRWEARGCHPQGLSTRPDAAGSLVVWFNQSGRISFYLLSRRTAHQKSDKWTFRYLAADSRGQIQLFEFFYLLLSWLIVHYNLYIMIAL